jgi:hypothetical protein
MITFDKYLYGNLKLVDERVVRKTASAYSDSRRIDIAKLVEWSGTKDNTIAVKAFNFQELTSYGGLYKYSYDMMRLGKLDGRQRFIVKFISDWIVDYHMDPFNPNSLSEIYRSQVESAWRTHKDLMFFLLSVVKEGRYKDLHEGNVMIHPETEEFKVIDLEGFTQGNPNLDWLYQDRLVS